MTQFEASGTVLSSKDVVQVVMMYKRVGRALATFEFLWYKAWAKSIGPRRVYKATLLILHPDDGKLNVKL